MFLNICEFLSLDDAILFSRLLLVYFFHNCVFLLLYLVSIFTNSFFVVQPLPFCSRVCDNSDRLYNFVLWGIALVLEGEILVWYLWCTNPSLPIVKLLFDVYWLQISGDFMTIASLNAENEILHTLAFLAGVMIWSQVCFWHFLLLENIVIFGCIMHNWDHQFYLLHVQLHWDQLECFVIYYSPLSLFDILCWSITFWNIFFFFITFWVLEDDGNAFCCFW